MVLVLGEQLHLPCVGLGGAVVAKAVLVPALLSATPWLLWRLKFKSYMFGPSVFFLIPRHFRHIFPPPKNKSIILNQKWPKTTKSKQALPRKISWGCGDEMAITRASHGVSGK